MPIHIVQLGSARADDEGVRIGTVRRPPRGVPRAEFVSKNWYDVWYPNLAPSAEAVKLALHASTPAEWKVFAKKYRAEMATPVNRHTLALLAELSRHTCFSVGCYCEDASRCHRSILSDLLTEAGATMA